MMKMDQKTRAHVRQAASMGMCRGDGCSMDCGPSGVGGQWCTALAVYGEWADAALDGLGRAGVALAFTRPVPHAHVLKRPADMHPETERLLVECLTAAVIAVNAPDLEPAVGRGAYINGEWVEDAVDTSDIPEATEADFKRGRWVTPEDRAAGRPGRPVEPAG